ncbi:TIGR01777 family oxidoreductase [uncultured Shewanella sp.]|uniref:TIGR01777 family oxidoreductase n=1 Tax=uncultured Shewanella sp. TaxID=173975 RepID=UPI00261115F2|nr:TIGR01777 family oxidoreductase [uncultured Shewanella sp.]
MNILITGATGFIGTQLVHALEQEHSLTLLSRHPGKAAQKLGTAHTYLKALSSLDHLNDIDIVINLAGEPIASKRWSHTQKDRICHSRWQITQEIASLIKKSSTPPQKLINASAIGFYGSHSNKAFDEDDIPQKETIQEFPHIVCKEWEKSANSCRSLQTQVIILRLGLVLGFHGGALSKMLPAFKLGLGGPIGDGKQGVSWIHQTDLVALILFMIKQTHCQGIFNATTPHPISQSEFAKVLAHTLKRPAIVPLPAFILKLALGEMSQLLTQGQFILPTRTLATGFQFQYPNINEALHQLLQST